MSLHSTSKYSTVHLVKSNRQFVKNSECDIYNFTFLVTLQRILCTETAGSSAAVMVVLSVIGLKILLTCL